LCGVSYVQDDGVTVAEANIQWLNNVWCSPLCTVLGLWRRWRRC